MKAAFSMILSEGYTQNVVNCPSTLISIMPRNYDVFAQKAFIYGGKRIFSVNQAVVLKAFQ